MKSKEKTLNKRQTHYESISKIIAQNYRCDGVSCDDCPLQSLDGYWDSTSEEIDKKLVDDYIINYTLEEALDDKN